LCGVSPTWYTWIEQGRPVSASADALARIAVALQLSKAERAYLFEPAAQRDPAEPDVAAGDLPPTLAATVAAIATPAYVLDRNGTRSRGTRRPPRCYRLARRRARSQSAALHVHGAVRAYADRRLETRARRLAAEFRADSIRHLPMRRPAR
jgi:transcriptional regulator with XRE-family HTH domain